MKQIQNTFILLLLLAATVYIYQTRLNPANRSAAPDSTPTQQTEEGVDQTNSAMNTAPQQVPVTRTVIPSTPTDTTNESGDEVARAEKLLDTPIQMGDTAERAEKLETVDRAEKLIKLEQEPLDGKFIAEDALFQFKTAHMQSIQNVRETKEILSPSAPR